MKKGKKLTSGILSVRDFEGGVCGILGEARELVRKDGTPVTGNFGQPLSTFDLADPKSGEVKTYWMDGGLKGAFALAKVQTGRAYFIEHTGEDTFEMDNDTKGRVQTYDIFEATE